MAVAQEGGRTLQEKKYISRDKVQFCSFHLIFFFFFYILIVCQYDG